MESWPEVVSKEVFEELEIEGACEMCATYFNRYSHNPDGECDCPRCQGQCSCKPVGEC
jgi:hypothetical protein